MDEIRRGDFFLIASGTMIPPMLVEVFPTLLFLPLGSLVPRELFSLRKIAPRRILPVNKLGHYVDEIRGGLWLPSSKLEDERLVGGVVSGDTYYIGVSGIEEFISFLGKPLDVISKTHPALLGVPLEVPGARRALVGALEVSDEGLPEVY